MSTTIVPQLLVNGLQPLSCLRCANRKVRCDRRNPCSNCIKHGVSCEFPQPRTEKRKRRKVPVAPAQSNDSTCSTAEDLDTMISVDSGMNFECSSESPERVSSDLGHSGPSRRDAVVKSAVTHPNTRGRREVHVQGNSRTRAAENRNASALVPDVPNISHQTFEVHSVPGGLIFGRTSGTAPLEDLYPTQQHFSVLWNVFLRNIHPITMIIHSPTTAEALAEAVNSLGDVSKDTEALLFAVLACALVSMTDADCLQRLGERKTTLLSKYRSGCESALINAEFLVSCDLVVLQAFMLYLSAIGSSIDPRELWNLLGIAKRNAQQLALHDEKLVTSLSPFEVEMQRRLWYGIVLADLTLSRSAGLHKSEPLPDITPPSNINDRDLSRNMREPAIEHTAATDMFFCNLQYRLTTFSFENNAGSDLEERTVNAADHSRRNQSEKAIAEFEEDIEVNFLRYCDALNPLHFLTAVVARSNLCRLRFAMIGSTRHNSFEELTTGEREHKFSMALKVIEYENSEDSQQLIQRFAWQTHRHLQWSCFLYILEDLKARPYGDRAQKAWDQIEMAYGIRPTLKQDKEFSLPRYPAIHRMTVEAWKAREICAIRCGHSLPTPSFIKKLREQNHHQRGPEQQTLITPTSLTTSPLYLADQLAYDAVPHPDDNAHEWLNWPNMNVPSSNNSNVIDTSFGNILDSYVELDDYAWNIFPSSISDKQSGNT